MPKDSNVSCVLSATILMRCLPPMEPNWPTWIWSTAIAWKNGPKSYFFVIFLVLKETTPPPPPAAGKDDVLFFRVQKSYGTFLPQTGLSCWQLIPSFRELASPSTDSRPTIVEIAPVGGQLVEFSSHRQIPQNWPNLNWPTIRWVFGLVMEWVSKIRHHRII